MSLFKGVIFIFVIIASVLDGTKANARVVSSQVHELKSQSDAKDRDDKSHIKTIKTRYGDIYDCVDFYEQPAFKHPLLRNHTFHPKMKPSIVPKSMNGEAKPKIGKEFYGLREEGCPFGTVPIRRHTKEQRDRAIKFSREQIISAFTPGYHFALLQSRTNSHTSKYYGVRARFGVFNPRIEDNQYSSAQCVIANGRDSIKFGWTVNPIYYHDKQTRTFIHTEVGDSRCYNTDCSGFIIVRQDLPLDDVLSQYSNFSDQVAQTMSVFRDPQSGNWWLGTGPVDTQIGFWPNQIMSGLADFGTYIECGGEAYSPSGYPRMGTGNHPVGKVIYDAFVEKFASVNEKFQIVDVPVEDSEKFVSSDKYSVMDLGFVPSDKYSGHEFVYGGPDLI